MIKAKIDCTCYPLVRIESKERLIVPRLALNVLEFDPGFVGFKRNENFLLYFREIENETD